MRAAQTVDKKLFYPEGGRIALSANERIADTTLNLKDIQMCQNML